MIGRQCLIFPRAAQVSFFCLLLAARAGGADECDPEATAAAMLENETKFVALGQEEGSRAASLAYLADDAIMFEPGPVNAKKTWQARTEAALSLKWEPTFAAMSRSCDLGFTTGPAEWRKEKTDEKPLGYGQYISVWKKQKRRRLESGSGRGRRGPVGAESGRPARDFHQRPARRRETGGGDEEITRCGKVAGEHGPD